MVEDRSRRPRLPSERLPIKLILPKQGKERIVQGGGPPATPFRNVDAEYRASLGKQVAAIAKTSSAQFARGGSVPVRVKILATAVIRHVGSENRCSDST